MPIDPAFPCSLTISIPLPTRRLASIALRALQVDAELSPLVRRAFSLIAVSASYTTDDEEIRAQEGNDATIISGIKGGGNGRGEGGVDGGNGEKGEEQDEDKGEEEKVVLKTEYKATTNRMLRVAVNGFMESLGVVLGVMAELDVDVLARGGDE